MTNSQHDFDRKFDSDIYDSDYFHGGTKSGYDNYAQAFAMVQKQNQIIQRAMSSNLVTTREPHGRLRSLDVGCAYGHGVDWWNGQGFEAHGFDVSEWAIEQAKTMYDTTGAFRQGDARIDFDYWTARNYGHDGRPNAPKFDIITACELFEHIPTPDIDNVLTNMQIHGKWGAFCINGRTHPDQPHDSNHGDHGHLNNHHMEWWIAKVAEYGIIDFDAMLEMSVKSYEFNKEVHWHNRYVVVKFNKVEE